MISLSDLFVFQALHISGDREYTQCGRGPSSASSPNVTVITMPCGQMRQAHLWLRDLRNLESADAGEWTLETCQPQSLEQSHLRLSTGHQGTVLITVFGNPRGPTLLPSRQRCRVGFSRKCIPHFGSSRLRREDEKCRNARGSDGGWKRRGRAPWPWLFGSPAGVLPGVSRRWGPMGSRIYINLPWSIAQASSASTCPASPEADGGSGGRGAAVLCGSALERFCSRWCFP
jgi:hypothetical protein